MMIKCQMCIKYFLTKVQYHKHLRCVHSHQSNFKVVCELFHCRKSFKNFYTYYNHLSKHKNIKPGHSVAHVCSLCSRKFSSFSLLFKHLKSHCTAGDQVCCPFDGCEKSYVQYNSLASHISRFHRNRNKIETSHYTPNDEGNTPCCSTDLAAENISEGILAFQNNTIEGNLDRSKTNDKQNQVDNLDVFNDGWKEEEFHHYLGLFFLKLQAKHGVPVETMQAIVSGIREVLDINYKCMWTKLSPVLVNCGLSIKQVEAIRQTPELAFGTMCLESFSTPYMRMKHYKKLNFVAPQEICLGRNNAREVCTYQYIPIHKTLLQLLNHDDVINNVSNQQFQNSGLLKDIVDGEFYKKNKLLNGDKKALCLILYYDEFEIVNPIGAHRKKHKMAAFYYTLGNISPEYRSTLKSIQLLIMCKVSYLKYFGLNKVLDCFITDMKQLSDVGLEVPGLGSVVCGVYCIAGDNLGSNFIGGYSECFRGAASYFCRTCEATGDACQIILHEDECSIRTVETYDKFAQSVTSKDLQSHMGIKFVSPFNSLPAFHVQEGLPPDVMHDLFEGIVPYELQLILCSLGSQGYITPTVLNMRILHFPLKDSDKKKKPVEQCWDFKKGIVGTAAQIWMLLRMLPIFIGDLIPEGNDAWRLLLHLRTLTEYLVCQIFTLGKVHVLQDIIQDHLQMFKEIFPGERLKPKHHFLIHYPRHILNYGPPICYWCFRFEAKHLVFKEIIRHAKQFTNPSQTLSVRHQLHQCFEHQSSSFFLSNIDCISVETFCPDSIEPNILIVILSKISAPICEISTCEGVRLNGTLYKINFCVASHYENDFLIWGIIKYIIVHGANAYFVLHLQSATYQEHYGVFSLESTGKYCCKSVKDLVDWYPLVPYHILSKNKIVIAVRHALHDDTCIS